MPTTITIKESTKEILKILKGKRDWDSFLKELAEEYAKMKRENARKELKKLFTEDLLKNIRVRNWTREF